MQAGRAADALAELEPLARNPQNALAEAARFYTAYGHLQQGDTDKAIAALDRTIELRGDRDAEASALARETQRAASGALTGGARSLDPQRLDWIE